ncbi:MAG: preprotein translocase subunit YajC [Paludibacteraceae bacterium]|nr:preprotein translocase subunit YajC [Paludibacteraceae bacterium]
MLDILLQAAPQQGGGWQMIIMLVMIFVVFYFFMVRPQKNKQKEIQKFRDSLKQGDQVITSGGIYGKVKQVKETTIELEIAHEVRVTVDKNCVFATAAETPASEGK